MPGIGIGIGLQRGLGGGGKWSPKNIQSKLLFWGKYSEISGGQMPNKVTGSSDYLTVTGSENNYTYQTPNTQAYIDADTDFIWFTNSGVQRTVTIAELVGYDLQRTPVKYQDDAPNYLEEIIILKAGEILTENEVNQLHKYMRLSIFWSGVLNAYGVIKSNRIGQKLYNPVIPVSVSSEAVSSTQIKVIITPPSSEPYDGFKIYYGTNGLTFPNSVTCVKEELVKTITVASIVKTYFRVVSILEGRESDYIEDTLLYGEELTVNGDFANGLTEWVQNANATGTATIFNGALKYSTPHGDYAETKQLNKAVVGTSYLVVFDVVEKISELIYVTVTFGRATIYNNTITSLPLGRITATVTATHSDGFSINVRTNGQLTIDNISVKRVL